MTVVLLANRMDGRKSCVQNWLGKCAARMHVCGYKCKYVCTRINVCLSVQWRIKNIYSSSVNTGNVCWSVWEHMSLVCWGVWRNSFVVAFCHWFLLGCFFYGGGIYIYIYIYLWPMNMCLWQSKTEKIKLFLNTWGTKMQWTEAYNIFFHYQGPHNKGPMSETVDKILYSSNHHLLRNNTLGNTHTHTHTHYHTRRHTLLFKQQNRTPIRSQGGCDSEVSGVDTNSRVYHCLHSLGRIFGHHFHQTKLIQLKLKHNDASKTLHFTC